MKNTTNTTSGGINRFDKELIKDINDYHVPENVWTHARNAINNSKTGDLGKIGNEPSNYICAEATYVIIGVIHIVADTWAIYSTNNTRSEIGIFKEDKCGLPDAYETVVNDDNCLNFKQTHLIKGVSRARSTCNYTLYWDDGLNPSRLLTVNVDNVSENAYTNSNSPIPWEQVCDDTTDCLICTNLPTLDCDKIRLAPFIKIPCITVEKGPNAGTLLNGSYQVAVAYSADSQKIGDWYISDIQPLFQHINGSNSLNVNLNNIDQSFDELQVAIISVTNGQTAARLAGTYNTRQQNLSFDTIDNTWPAVPISEFPLTRSVVDKTDDMFVVNDYLIRTGPTSKLNFNYQPLANQIITKWQSVEYPKDYYRKGGNNTGYLRDEVYAFFIRWVYDTGDKSFSYHIPGRAAIQFDIDRIGGRDNRVEVNNGITPNRWRAYSTATYSPTSYTLEDGGRVIAEGLMGYWESSEKYPDNKPEVWSVNNPNHPEWDLCGKNIRHHRFPDLYILDPSTGLASSLINSTQYLSTDKQSIRLMGVKFENIQIPVDLDGNPIQNVVGYEILRGTRNGNKTIIAKGIVCNMRRYVLPNTSSRVGAFVNYPYNDLREDPFLSNTATNNTGCAFLGGNGVGERFFEPNGSTDNTRYFTNLFSFHSPDTNFTDPFLSAKEFKVNGEVYGGVTGKFDISENHPKEKLISNFSFLISFIAGVGAASLAMTPERKTKYIPPKYSTPTSLLAAGSGTIPDPVTLPFVTGINAATTSQQFINEIATFDSSLLTAASIGGQDLYKISLYSRYFQDLLTYAPALAALGISPPDMSQEYSETEYSRVPGSLKILQAVPTFLTYLSQGTDSFLNLIKVLVAYRDYALRYHSHAYYDNYNTPRIGDLSRRIIEDAQYVGPQLVEIGTDVRVNNIFRAKTVAIQTEADGLNDAPLIPLKKDITRILASNVDALYDQVASTDRLVKPYKQEFSSNDINDYRNLTDANDPGDQPQIASSLYVSLKQRIQNQYGQINGVQQFPASCVFPAPEKNPDDGNYYPVESDVIFGGDTYMGRYTEKNTFFFFYNWLYGQPDGAEFDYTKNEMIPYPRFWANFDQFETGDFISSVGTSLSGLLGGNPPPTGLITPSDFYNLDGLYCPDFLSLRFSIKHAWFYLFNSGVKDFWVESEINVDLRDWGELDTELHYDPYRYTDTKNLFQTAIIKSGNYYKYDFSLSISKLWNNYISWAAVQTNNYSPYLAETCYVYSPKRVIYSLPAQFESLRDNWRVFLPNNYKDFLSRVRVIKSINKSGALILFDNESPILFQGIDQLQTTNGVKLTIGDGGLFTQPLQNVVNVDRPFEYASCQDRYSTVNTPYGLFWISQNQGKIFQFQGGLGQITMQNLKWWFTNFLPYKLTDEFPDFELTDNPVIGIGCQSIYDNENELIYFTKKDYIVRRDLPEGTVLRYVRENIFNLVILNVVINQDIYLGDPQYFEDASWTMSYDPKIKSWISFHDWHPSLMIPGKNTFMTIKESGIWKHNEACDSYCNFYGENYPFEIEFLNNTKTVINTLRNIEYYMEVYKYDDNCQDRFHVLDYNFDEAVIYNTEQCSGLLKLTLEPKNDPFAALEYPIINFSDIEILYSKEENKYRFNQFWDITDDRGEYNPNAERVIWNTQPNGYVRILNPNNLNYNKTAFERKKFRHYTNSIFLRKNISGNRKILMLFAIEKYLMSTR